MSICPRHGVELIQPIGELADVCPTCREEQDADIPNEVLAVAGLSRDEIYEGETGYKTETVRGYDGLNGFVYVK